MPDVLVAPALTDADLAAARALFREYVRSPEFEAEFQQYLAQQAFDEELAGLPGKYAPPRGALLLARVGDEPAGCVACKPLAPGTCEMKRLFVRPAWRSHGVGAALVRAVVESARAAGFARMRLDTLPSMAGAQRLYERVGFREIGAYVAHPVPGARFLELDLDAAAGR